VTPAEMLMKLSLAEADIQFAKAKCCQAEVAMQMGLSGIGLRSMDGEMALAKEAADRAVAHLGKLD